MAPSQIDQGNNYHCPRILCLHGGGTTAEIMQRQCRTFIRDLSSHFRLVFADGPFFCEPHPAIIPVYEEFGPFRRWTRWLPSHPEIEGSVMIDEIEYQIRSAMEYDDRLGGYGPWIGLLGFSQGAKIAASILYETQLRLAEASVSSSNTPDAQREGYAGGDWKFAVCLAGRGPFVSLRDQSGPSEPVERPEVIADAKAHLKWTEPKDRLCLPVIHVHGLKDEGLHLHRIFLEHYCDPKTSTFLEWDGDHRIPYKSDDVLPVVKQIHHVVDTVHPLNGSAPAR